MTQRKGVDILHDYCPDMATWLWQIEPDPTGWWLTRAGRRRNRNPWRPADELEAYVAATLLYMLNDAGPAPLPGVPRKGDEEKARTYFMTRAYSLFVRHLMR